MLTNRRNMGGGSENKLNKDCRKKKCRVRGGGRAPPPQGGSVNKPPKHKRGIRRNKLPKLPREEKIGRERVCKEAEEK